MQIEKYFDNLEEEINKAQEIAEKARKKGLDPVDNVEVPLEHDVAEKVIRII